MVNKTHLILLYEPKGRNWPPTSWRFFGLLRFESVLRKLKEEGETGRWSRALPGGGAPLSTEAGT